MGQSCLAAPQGGVVVAGQAHINVVGKQTSITQSSQRAAINWQDFNVAADESVYFTVPNGGATLNRVVGLDPSSIAGTLSSNGTLFLVNPNGMAFETGSQVFAQNFVASTANMTTANFMAGQYEFDQASPNHTAKITLRGTITARDRGLVGIFAPQVENQGIITANLGTVVLGGAATEVIDFTGDGLFNFELGDPTAADLILASVSNQGTINAAGGTIALDARGARQLVAATVENSGNLNATSLTAHGGTVTLWAEGGTVTDSGAVESSGVTGGGTILMGGNFHGAAPAAAISGRIVLNSEQVTVTHNATITADGLGSGHGGNIVIWSDIHSQFLGRISAQGGSLAGDGGKVEVSGKKTLDFQGRVTTLAPHGKTGSLLLDPSDVLIGAITDTVVREFNSNAGTTNSSWSEISPEALSEALASNDVTINAVTSNYGSLDISPSESGTDGYILLSGRVSWSSSHNLTLIGTAIDIENDITAGGSINLTQTGNAQNNTGIVVAGNLTTRSGNITLTQTGSTGGQGIYVFGGKLTTRSGNITLTQSGSPDVHGIDVYNSTLTTTSGNITFTQSGNAGRAGIYAYNGTLTTSSGNITLTQSGRAGEDGIAFDECTLTSTNGDISLTQSGRVSGGDGIYLYASTLTATSGNLSLLQTGTVTALDDANSYYAMRINGTDKNQTNHVRLNAGTNNWVTIKTKNGRVYLDNYTNSDNFTVTGGNLRLDLGSGVIQFTDLRGEQNKTINATGMNVFYTGAATGNFATLKARSFTVVHRATGDQILAAAGPAVAINGLTVIDGTGNIMPITSYGVGYAATGLLTITPETSAGYRYLEAATITGKAAFRLGLVLTNSQGNQYYSVYAANPNDDFLSPDSLPTQRLLGNLQNLTPPNYANPLPSPSPPVSNQNQPADSTPSDAVAFSPSDNPEASPSNNPDVQPFDSADGNGNPSDAVALSQSEPPDVNPSEPAETVSDAAQPSDESKKSSPSDSGKGKGKDKGKDKGKGKGKDKDKPKTAAAKNVALRNSRLWYFYKHYAPLRRLSDDLAVNYLFPMIGNQELWDLSRKSDENQ